MEVYRAETHKILRRFQARQIDRHACIAALDAALAGIVRDLAPAELPAVQMVMRENEETMALEAERRKKQPPTPRQDVN